MVRNLEINAQEFRNLVGDDIANIITNNKPHRENCAWWFLTDRVLLTSLYAAMVTLNCVDKDRLYDLANHYDIDPDYVNAFLESSL